MPYKHSTHSFVSEDSSIQERLAADHWLYKAIPRHRSQICWYDAGHWITWGLLGNDDDGIFGETTGYQPNCSPSVGQALCWTLRNPFHNFLFYVIGTAQFHNSTLVLVQLSRERCECFQYYPDAHNVYAGTGPSLYVALHGWKPFISTRLLWTRTKESRFYLGWRGRGNFGITCVPLGNRKNKPISH